MERSKVETVRRVYALANEDSHRRTAGGAGDAPSLTELFDPGVVIEENAAFPDAATYQGYDGLVRWWSAFFELYDDIRFEPLEYKAVGDRVAVHVRHWLHSRAGVGLEREITHVWTLRSGRVVHVTGYNDRSDALAAVQLPS